MIHFLTSLFDGVDTAMYLLLIWGTMLFLVIGTSLMDEEFNKHAYSYLLLAAFLLMTALKTNNFPGAEESRMLLLQVLDLAAALSIFGSILSITPDYDRAAISLALATIVCIGYGFSLAQDGWLVQQIKYWVPFILCILALASLVFMAYNIFEYFKNRRVMAEAY